MMAPIPQLAAQATDYLAVHVPDLAGAAARSAVVLLLAFAVTFLMRRASAASRHVVWVSAILIALITPLLGIVAPHWDARVLPAQSGILAIRASEVAPPAPLPSLVWRDASGRYIATGSNDVAPAAPPAMRITSLAREDVAARAPWYGGNWIALIWLAGAVAVLARLCIGTLVVWRTAKRSARTNDERWLSLASRIAARLGISRRITLLTGADQVVPVTWGIIHPVVLLPESADDWDTERREAVLVHELAHVVRFDALTQMVIQLAVAVFWFNPLIWMAARRVRAERERACDDLVLTHGTRASAYADDLLTMVRVLTRNTEPAFAALAMARRSEFEGRMLAILDPRIDRRRPGRRGVAIALLASLAIALPLAAFRPLPRRSATRAIAFMMSNAPWDGAAGCGTRSGHHISINSNDSESTFSVSDGKRCLVVRTTGTVKYGDDDTHVESISSGGHISITETVAGVERRYEAGSGSGGLDETFYLDGKRVDAASGRPWLRTVIPQIVRQNAELAPARAARIRSKEGIAGVLAEVTAISGDYAKRAYLDALIAQERITSDSLRTIADAGARELSSDYDRAEFLARVAHMSHDPATSATIAAAAAGMSSDYYKTELLSSALASGSNEGAVARNVLASTRGMKSDYYRASLLLGVLARPHLDDDMLLSVIASASAMTSDYYRATALDSVANSQSLAARRVYTALLQSADGITGSYGHASVLETILRRNDLTADLAAATIGDVATLTSDSDKGRLLDLVAGTSLMKDAAVRDAFLRTAKTINSAGAYRRVVERATP